MSHRTDAVQQTARGLSKRISQNLRGRGGIYALLAQEHGEADTLMTKIAHTSNDEHGRRRELFRQLKADLLTHASLEDEIFYVELAKHSATSGDVGHAREEHAEMEQLLRELSDLPIDHQSWKNKFDRLHRVVEHHVSEEEGEVFPKARDVLSDDDAQRMEDEYRRRRASA